MAGSDAFFQHAHIKLADFGPVSVFNNGALKERCGIVASMAPEPMVSCSGHSHGLEADVWSCGVVLHPHAHRLEVVHHPLELTERKLSEMIDKMKTFEPPQRPSSGARELLRRSLAFVPKKRTSPIV
jgi:serine/threonine protein kinase